MAPTPSIACPGCGHATAPERFEGHYGRALTLDVCHACNGVWFDPRERQQLSPAGSLALLEAMRARAATARAPQLEAHACPRCGEGLLPTHDRVRDEPVTYLACPKRCGRFSSFAEYLKEQRVARDASHGELAQLRAQVQQVACSRCGAPIDLAAHVVCPHCDAPVALLDPLAVAALLAQAPVPDRQPRAEADAQQVARLLAEAPRRAVDPLTAGIDALLGLFRGGR